MFIQTEETPNPEAIKFIPGRPVMDSGTLELTSPHDLWRCPMAASLFEVSGVAGVFLGSDFITVSKAQDAQWAHLKPQILAKIMDYMTAHAVVEVKSEQKTDTSSQDTQLDKEILELIDTRVRPAVAQDGGDIEYDHFDDGIVYLKLKGSCAGCPSSTETLKSGIENMLRYYIPEVTEVRAI